MPRTSWQPITGYLLRVGRPRQPPTISRKLVPDGSERFLVRAVVLGKDRRKVVATYDEAKLLATQWMGDRTEELRVLPTRLSAGQLRNAEAAELLLKPLGLTFLEAAIWLQSNYRRPASVRWDAVIEEYQTERRKIGISESQVTNVAKVAKRLAAHVARDTVGCPSRDEVLGLLGTLGKDASPATYNGLLGDVATFLAWLRTRQYIADNPATGIERRRVSRKLPEILSPSQVENLLRDLQRNDPDWLPYATLCVFGALRPGLREGEANRLDADLRASRSVLHPGGVEIRGKAHGTRIIPWDLCGPLRQWLGNGTLRSLWPQKSGPAAERSWAKIRSRHNLSADVLRHTAITAMCYAPNASLAQVAIAVGNSEPMIRKHYLGRWSSDMTEQFHGIIPKTSAIERPHAHATSQNRSPFALMPASVLPSGNKQECHNQRLVAVG